MNTWKLYNEKWWKKKLQNKLERLAETKNNNKWQDEKYK
jgi:hypothetical protein